MHPINPQQHNACIGGGVTDKGKPAEKRGGVVLSVKDANVAVERKEKAQAELYRTNPYIRRQPNTNLMTNIPSEKVRGIRYIYLMSICISLSVSSVLLVKHSRICYYFLIKPISNNQS